MHVHTAALLALLPLSASAFFHVLIPESRRGRANLGAAAAADDDLTSGSVRVNDDADADTEVLRSLIASVMEEAAAEGADHPPIIEISTSGEASLPPTGAVPNGRENSDAFDQAEYNRKYGYERNQQPRNVDSSIRLGGFGAAMQRFAGSAGGDAVRPGTPQLFNPHLLGRQNPPPSDAGDPASGFFDVPDSSDSEMRCIPKVMQIEETVYDHAIKCKHSYQEKCHMTYVTDYRSTTEEKCETTFKKNCHITFKPMPFNDSVSFCHTPVVRRCGSEPVGPDICSTYYETSCETRYKTHEVEQDEPVCTMEIMEKCENITLPLPPGFDQNGNSGGGPGASAPATPREGRRRRRQTGDPLDPPSTLTTVDISAQPPPAATDGGDAASAPLPAPASEGLTLDQNCEEWPVQTCTIQKKLVKKVHPDSSCKKIPREVCVPNNCAMVPGEEVCRDETRVQIQNIPQEECELQPHEQCHMEAVLVPRLVPEPKCVKVPKEICVNTKKNPRVVKKPIVKEWCYNPKDLVENGASFPVGLLGGGEEEEAEEASGNGAY